MLRKVVVGTDFSKPSEAVLDYLPRLRYAGLEHVLLTHVAHLVNVAGFEQVAMQAARESLEEQARRLRSHGLQVETELLTGAVAVELADVAEDLGAGAIVVGSHGRSLLGRILLGSVSMSLLHQARVPTLIVRMELCETDEGISCELQPERPFDHLLFPTDLSEASGAAFERIRPLAAATGARVTLYHVDNPPAYDEGAAADMDALHAEARGELERMADELRESGIDDVRTIVTTGAPAVSAVRYAESEGVTIIAMATQGRGAMEELMVGSVALKVARTSPVPVLMIPRRR
ncbi:MAG: universal stress protein [Armatimonadota bacterium]|jgi:nucleotide-binding universal stress UspA family protein